MTEHEPSPARAWWLEHIWHRLVLQLGEPSFFTEDETELAERLRVSEPGLAEELLAEAKEMDDRIRSSTESIESRAMTLQGAIAIATTLALAAAGLLLDRTNAPSHGWTIAFAASLTATVAAFIGSGLRALQASSKTYAWAFPGYNDIFEHARMERSEAQAARAAAYLKSVGLNQRIVSVKGGYLNAAVFWFRAALALLSATALLLLAYAIDPDTPAAHTRNATPRAAAATIPVLGRPWSSAQQGYGRARPSTIFNGGDPTGLVRHVMWKSWGSKQAIGDGLSTYVRPGTKVANNAPNTRAEVVAFDLGTCHGLPSYNALEWFYPQFGEAFDPSRYIDTCSGRYVGSSPSSVISP